MTVIMNIFLNAHVIRDRLGVKLTRPATTTTAARTISIFAAKIDILRAAGVVVAARVKQNLDIM